MRIASPTPGPLLLLLPLLLSACVTGGGAPRGRTPQERPAAGRVLAVVGEHRITDAELRQRILERYYGRRALLGLVREALFLQEAERLGIEVSSADVDDRVDAEMVRLFGKEQGERQRALDGLRRRGLGSADVRRELRAEVKSSLLLERVVAAHRRVTELQIQELYRDSYALERRRVRHIALPFGAEGPPGDERVAEVLARARAVRAELLGGEDFAAAARRYSGNQETALGGGEIGWVARDSLADEELNAGIFALAEGELSEPLRERDYGYHIFRVDEIVEARPLAAVRDELAAKLRQAAPTDEEIAEVEILLRARTPVWTSEVDW